MTRFLVYLSLLLALPAWATSAAKKPACGERGLAGAPNLPTRDAILRVPLEDEVAILTFIASVTPLPKGDTPGDLKRVLVRFWSLFRPDLSAEQINERVAVNAPSSQGLRTLRLKDEVKKRPEVGRLRLTWMAFVADVVSGVQAPDPAIRHRAEVLALGQMFHHVLGYLDRTVGPGIRLEDESPAKAMRHFYATYLPHHEIPDLTFNGQNRWERGLELVAFWRAYVDASASQAPIKMSLPTQVTSPFKYDVDPTADPSTVPTHPQAMVAYMVKRYPDVKWRELRGIWKLIEALRNDWDLGPTLKDIAPSAATSIIWQQDARIPNIQMELIWEEFLNDREKKLKAR